MDNLTKVLMSLPGCLERRIMLYPYILMNIKIYKLTPTEIYHLKQHIQAENQDYGGDPCPDCNSHKITPRHKCKYD